MERELKFLLGKPHLPPLPAGYRVSEPQASEHLFDEYLDYRGQILAAGWRLRRRRSEGEAARFTLKGEHAIDASGPLSERIELERTGEPSEGFPSEIVAALVGAGIDAERLLKQVQPYLTLRQERHSFALFAGEERFALLSIDEVRASATQPGVEHRWVELEIEFLAATTAAVRKRTADELTAWFSSQPGVTFGGESKVLRAAQLLSIFI